MRETGLPPRRKRRGFRPEDSMKNVLEKLNLRDPVWQAVGTIIGVVALLVSTIVAYDIFQRSAQFSGLTIEEVVHFDPLEDSFGEAMKGRIALLIDNAVVESATVYYFSISNTGKNPIAPNDYIEPLRVSVESPWELLANDTPYSSPPELKVAWTRIMTNAFEMEPALLNPGDTIGVLLFATNPTSSLSERKFWWPPPDDIAQNLSITCSSRNWNLHFSCNHGLF